MRASEEKVSHALGRVGLSVLNEVFRETSILCDTNGVEVFAEKWVAATAEETVAALVECELRTRD